MLNLNAIGNKETPILINPDTAPTVQRIFHLYSRGNTTFLELSKKLAAEGRFYTAGQHRFARTMLSYILNNRFYIGEIEWHGERHQGRHQPLIERGEFEACQDILTGRNRRNGTVAPTIPYGGGLFRCGHCGNAMIGEVIKKRLSGGGYNLHTYYKCHGNGQADHPTTRWKQERMEDEVLRELARMKMREDEAAWFREALEAGFKDEDGMRREQRSRLKKRREELKGMQDRLLAGFLGGAIDETIFKQKSAEFRIEDAELAEQLEAVTGPTHADLTDWALTTFDFSQKAIELWTGSTWEARREILDCLTSNRIMTNATLYLTKRKPFDSLVEGPLLKNGTGGWN